MKKSLNNKFKHLLSPLGVGGFIGGLFLLASSLLSCSDIKEDDRFIQLPAVEAKRVVLIEEFTGQACVQCPAAHEILADLLQKYPDNLISVSLHGGGMAWNEEKVPLIGLANAESEKYYTDYKVEAPPAAVINRTTGVINSPMWESAIRKEIERPAVVDLAVDYVTLSADGKDIKMAIDITPWETMEANLQVWVVESGITAMQLGKDENKKDKWFRDYVHNHVFRAAVNGHDGERLKLTTRQPQTKEYTIAVRDDDKCKWDTANLSIVVFLYNSSGVLQAAHAPLAQ